MRRAIFYPGYPVHPVRSYVDTVSAAFQTASPIT